MTARCAACGGSCRTAPGDGSNLVTACSDECMDLMVDELVLLGYVIRRGNWVDPRATTVTAQRPGEGWSTIRLIYVRNNT